MTALKKLDQRCRSGSDERVIVNSTLKQMMRALSLHGPLGGRLEAIETQPECGLVGALAESLPNCGVYLTLVIRIRMSTVQ